MTVVVKSTGWPYRVKEPFDSGAKLSYGIDWTDWLPEGASIVSSTWAIVGGVELHRTHVDGVAYVWIEAAAETVAGDTIEMTNHIILDTAPVGLEDERTLILKVKER
jgi:hypothetical protein